jgi:hypothetical protein
MTEPEAVITAGVQKPPVKAAWSSSIVRRIETTPPILVLGSFMLVGLLLLVGSIVAGVDSVPFTGGKKVGYFNEINWSWNFILCIPIALYFCAAALSCIRQVIRDLADANMIIDESGRAAPEADLLSDWHRTVCSWVRLVIILAAAGLIASWLEWTRVCVMPLYSTASAGEPLLPGWNIAPIGSAGATRIGTATFGFFAYTAQGVVAGAFLAFVVSVLAFSAWIYRYTTDESGEELVPDLTTDDTRRGFENFGPFVENLLFASVSFFFVFFMTRLDQLFVTSTSGDIGSFISGDVAKGFFDGVKTLFTKGDATLFATGDKLLYSTAMVFAGLCVTIAIAFIVPAVILRQAASASRSRLDHVIDRHPEVLNRLQLTKDEAHKRLASMTFWPLKYPAPLQLTLITALAFGCFVFYKLTLALVGVMLFLGVREVLRALGYTSKPA